MSIASEYNEYLDKVRFYCPNSGELIARVESEFDSFGFRFVHQDTLLTPEEAIAMAHWIIDTFSDYPEEAEHERV